MVVCPARRDGGGRGWKGVVVVVMVESHVSTRDDGGRCHVEHDVLVVADGVRAHSLKK
jgi:hypothetical protein